MISVRRHAIQATVAGLVLSALTPIATPAFAAAPTPSGPASFPMIANAPDWYVSALPAPYANSLGGASPVQDDQSKSWTERITYYSPAGSPPQLSDDSRAADIRVVNYAVVDLMGGPVSTDPEVVPLSISEPFPQMVTDVGTSMTTGVVLPADPNSGDTNEVSPNVRFLGNGLLLVRRPTFPTSCDAKDPASFTIQTVMLGVNGYKYRVQLDVNFGSRADVRRQLCAGAGKSDSGSDAKPVPASTQIADAGKDTKASVKKDLAAAVDKVEPKPKDNSGVTAVMFGVLGFMVLLGLGISLFKKLPLLMAIIALLKNLRRPNKHDNAGRLINPGDNSDDIDGAPRRSGGSPTKPVRKSVYGR